MAYGDTLGAPLIGSLVTSMLYGMMCLQCYYFYEHFKKEQRWLKISVAVLWLLNTAHLAFIGQSGYTFLVTNYGNPAVLLDLPWSGAAMAICTTFTTLQAQCLYSYRLWILFKHTYLPVVPVLFLILLGTGFGFASNIMDLVQPSLSQYKNMHWLAFGNLSFSAAADIYIAIALCYVFFEGRRHGVSHQTYSTINTLIVYTISTGLLTSIVAFSVLLLTAIMPDNYVFMGVYFVQGELYSNSLMAMLNTRERLRQELVAPPEVSVISFACRHNTCATESDDGSAPSYGQLAIEATLCSTVAVEMA